MLWQFLSVTGALFWIGVSGVLVLVAIILASAEREAYDVAVAALCLALALTVFFTDALAGARWLVVVIAAVAYMAIGVVWALWKWRAFVIEAADKARTEYVTTPKAKDELGRTETFEAFCNRRGKKPFASDETARIRAWIALWPWSLTWWVLTWPRAWADYALRRLASTFQRITDNAFGTRG